MATSFFSLFFFSDVFSPQAAGAHDDINGRAANTEQICSDPIYDQICLGEIISRPAAKYQQFPAIIAPKLGIISQFLPSFGIHW